MAVQTVQSSLYENLTLNQRLETQLNGEWEDKFTKQRNDTERGMQNLRDEKTRAEEKLREKCREITHLQNVISEEKAKENSKTTTEYVTPSLKTKDSKND